MPNDRSARRKPLDTQRLFQGSGADADLDYILAGPDEETAPRAAERGLPVQHIAVTAIAPDLHQLRRLPHPDDLAVLADAGDIAAAALLDGIDALAESLRAHGQLQPVVVYADADPQNPTMTHRLLHGQRRWSAALRAGLATLWAVEVERPTESVRIQRQFDENERREGFTDIERAWAIMRLREALTAECETDVPWTDVEARLRLSDSRRRDLLRLLRFTEEAQGIILRYRWTEWTLRPLHMAISAEDISQAEALAILHELTVRDGVTAPLVANLVAQVRDARTPDAAGMLPDARAAAVNPAGTGSPPSATAATLVQQLARLRHRMDRVSAQVHMVTDTDTRKALLTEAGQLMTSLETLLQTLAADSMRSEEPPE